MRHVEEPRYLLLILSADISLILVDIHLQVPVPAFLGEFAVIERIAFALEIVIKEG